ncbi:MAG TPA: c-type cytochrome [Longimicrobiales bacterium]|nr:c-type cytochrome [Longimicrobiales bacterium]
MRWVVLAAVAGTSMLATGEPAGERTSTVALVDVAGAQAVQPQQAGRSVFEGKGNCATCHGKEGKGTPLGPDLTDREWLNVPAGTAEAIAALVRTGVAQPKKHPAPMPPMGGARLRPAEIDAVAQYVASFAPLPERSRSQERPAGRVRGGAVRYRLADVYGRRTSTTTGR